MKINKHYSEAEVQSIKVTFKDNTILTVAKDLGEGENLEIDFNYDLDIVDICNTFSSDGKMFSSKVTEHYIICMENVKFIDLFY